MWFWAFGKGGDIGDTYLGVWRAGAIVLSSNGTLAQRKNLLRRKYNIYIDQKQASC